MTVSELDRWRVAQQIINSHGADAQAECGRRAAEFVKKGELEGFYLWQAIALKVKQLQDETAKPGGTN
jgi:hypothetical protein